MTDKQKMEEILPALRTVFASYERGHQTKFGIKFYEESSHRTNKPEDTYFSVKFEKAEVTHSTWKTLSFELEVESLNDFNFDAWVSKVKRVLESRAKIITVDGVKYAPITDEDDFPF